jgi:hypothetical protein
VTPQLSLYNPRQPSVIYLLPSSGHSWVSKMSLQTFGKGALRVAKNYTKGYSDTQAKVRDATSNDPWGPSGTQMNEIAQMTYNQCVVRALGLAAC